MLQNLDPKFKNNQGFINGQITRLYLRDREEMRAYAETLTDEQRSIARDHLRTYVLALSMLDEIKRRKKERKEKEKRLKDCLF